MQKSRSSETSTDLGTGAKIGRYVVLEHVGSGAMGVVYSAYDPELDRRIAVKLLKAQSSDAGAGARAPARLLREAKAMARLSHPNVIAVHDVGLFDDQVFLAMEFLNGGTLKSWLAGANRTWNEILKVFVAAGRGLAAAHAAGLVHRDFKPDNVLLDTEGRPRVVDFGLARDAAGATDDSADLHPIVNAPEAATLPAPSTKGGAHLQTLTRTGALAGTPAYMAPEQFLGERTDERTDQFSFCVALFEALYGERPFAGDDLLSLSVSVTEGQLRPIPKDRDVPAWIRRVILRGLRKNPQERYPSMAAAIVALEDDPAVRRRRRVFVAVGLGLLIVSLLVARAVVLRKRMQAEREIARHVDAATESAKSARARAAEASNLRSRAWQAFDGMDPEQGDSVWRQARALLPEVENNYERAEKSLESALVLDEKQVAVRRQLADVLFDHLLFCESFRLQEKVPRLRTWLATVDADGSKRKALSAPGSLVLRTTPAATKVLVDRYEREANSGRRVLVPTGLNVGTSAVAVAPGSYRLTVAAGPIGDVLYPFEIGRDEQLVLDLKLVGAVPPGFVYIPAGRFWFGDADEQLRTQFLGAVPIHRRETGPYFIARHETTYAEWIAFLEDLPSSKREKYLPDASAATRGSVRMRDADGRWQLKFQPATYSYTALAGERLSYIGRKQLVEQDWLRFPVAGVSPSNVDAYLGWLQSTGRVPGARLCTETEWERAARGADDRLFPHGDELAPSEGNFDATYGRVGSAYGPDVVGAHPQSRSPFGVDDLAGNVLEFAVSSQKRDELVLRGGAYYFNSLSCRSTNREPAPQMLRDVTTGFRVCASVNGGSNVKLQE